MATAPPSLEERVHAPRNSLTCEVKYRMSPTRDVLSKVTLSIEAVRMCGALMREAEMYAHCSIHDMTCPPKVMFNVLACWGMMLCVM